ELWHDDGHAVVVLDGRAGAVQTLEALRRAGVRRVDLVITRTGGVSVGEVVRSLDARYGVAVHWAPVGHSIRGGTVPEPGERVRAGRFIVTVDSVDPRLDVRVERAG